MPPSIAVRSIAPVAQPDPVTLYRFGPFLGAPDSSPFVIKTMVQLSLAGVPYRAVAGKLKLAYSQFEELEAFSRFGTRLDEHTQQVIGHGQRIRACLAQPQFSAVPVLEQIVLLQALTGGLLDAIALERVPAAEAALRAAIAQAPETLRQRCLGDGELAAADGAAVAQIVAGALAPFKP